MSLVLTYEGPLPTRAAESAKAVKNQIRRVLYPQLVEFCRNDMHFSYLSSPPSGAGPKIGGISFVAVVRTGLEADLRVEILRRDRPGGIFNGGDIDGRIKTLFDGLRVPHQETEIHGFTPTGKWDEDWCLCLLADDSLITRVAIETHVLLRPLRAGENKTDVEIRMQVTIKQSGTF